MRSTASGAALLAAALLLGSCDEQSAAPEPRLDRAEALRLNGAFLELAARAGTLQPLEGAHPCAPAGTIAVRGALSPTFDPETGAGGVDADLALSPQGCAYDVGGGRTVVVSGDPRVEVRTEARFTGDAVASYRVLQTGAFTWKRDDGTTGRCEVDVAAETDPQTGETRLSGTVCGWALDPAAGDAPAEAPVR